VLHTFVQSSFTSLGESSPACAGGGATGFALSCTWGAGAFTTGSSVFGAGSAAVVLSHALVKKASRRTVEVESVEEVIGRGPTSPSGRASMVDAGAFDAPFF
jgi:hypothetical protein